MTAVKIEERRNLEGVSVGDVLITKTGRELVIGVYDSYVEIKRMSHSKGAVQIGDRKRTDGSLIGVLRNYSREYLDYHFGVEQLNSAGIGIGVAA